MKKVNLLMMSLIGFGLMVTGQAAHAVGEQVDRCDSLDLASAPVGTICLSGEARWQVQSDNGNRIFYDMKSKLKVTGIIATNVNFDQAQSSCPAGYHVPSVGLDDPNESSYDPHNQTGEFGTLNVDGICHKNMQNEWFCVIPDMQNHWFWSSSDPFWDGDNNNPDEGAFTFVGDSGYVTGRVYKYQYLDNSAVVCVSASHD